jgi:hypothetical protein
VKIYFSTPDDGEYRLSKKKPKNTASKKLSKNKTPIMIDKRDIHQGSKIIEKKITMSQMMRIVIGFLKSFIFIVLRH